MRAAANAKMSSYLAEEAKLQETIQMQLRSDAEAARLMAEENRRKNQEKKEEMKEAQLREKLAAKESTIAEINVKLASLFTKVAPEDVKSGRKALQRLFPHANFASIDIAQLNLDVSHSSVVLDISKQWVMLIISECRSLGENCKDKKKLQKFCDQFANQCAAFQTLLENEEYRTELQTILQLLSPDPVAVAGTTLPAVDELPPLEILAVSSQPLHFTSSSTTTDQSRSHTPTSFASPQQVSEPPPLIARTWSAPPLSPSPAVAQSPLPQSVTDWLQPLHSKSEVVASWVAALAEMGYDDLSVITGQTSEDFAADLSTTAIPTPQRRLILKAFTDLLSRSSSSAFVSICALFIDEL